MRRKENNENTSSKLNIFSVVKLHLLEYYLSSNVLQVRYEAQVNVSARLECQHCSLVVSAGMQR